MSAVEVRHLSAAYEKREVLQDVSLALEAGEMVALLGANGAGKTSLLRCLTDWVKPHTGTVEYFGKRLSARERARQVAVVPQQLVVTMPYRVAELLAVSRAASMDDARFEALLAQTAVREFLGRVFLDLSGGEQQRVLLAFALASDPKVLLLDEPSSHLDLRYQIELFALVRRLSQKENLTVLAACHDLNLAAHFFPRLVLMQQGAIVADGAPAEVLQADILEAAYGCRVQVRDGVVLPMLDEVLCSVS